MAEAPLATDDDLRQAEAYEDFSSGTLKKGTQLGRYELVLPVAVGGMARVWAARMYGHRGFTKLVAIKTILPHLARDPAFERMFLDEARIASGVHHPNVCEIYELGEERGVLYLAMEWVSGDSLARVLKRRMVDAAPKADPLDPRIAARIIADACAGLHAAHNLTDDEGTALNVVHRDVAPQNILVSADGNVKVADFGVAKALGEGHEATARGQLKGRIAYMAPEQAMGGAIDRRSDLFALGVVLYEATTGKQPFRGDGEYQVMQSLLHGHVTPPSRVVKGYPYELERVVLRAMAHQPLNRFTTMDQMRVALEEWLAKSGPVVTQSHVAAVVRERVGAEIDKRREHIRAASSPAENRGARDSHHDTMTDASQSGSGVVTTGNVPSALGRASAPPEKASVTPPPPPPEKASMTPPPPPPAPSAPPAQPSTLDGAENDSTSASHASPLQYALASAVGVAVAGMIAVAAFFAWRTMDPPVTQAVQASAASAASATIGPDVPSAEAHAAVSAPILFKVVPDEAILVVDGAPLAAGMRALPRPGAGDPRHVIVRAEGFADETLTIDESAPASVDVWLTPLKKDAKPAEPRPTETRAPAPSPVKKATNALPANPY
jgi:serine/threonine protein kinase